MITFIRSLNELMLTTKARDNEMRISKCIKNDALPEDSAQRKRYIKSLCNKEIELPDVNKTTREKWVKSKKAISKFFHKLDSHSKIYTSSNGLKLKYRQDNSKKEAA